MKFRLCLFFSVFMSFTVSAQEDLLDLIDDSSNEDVVFATFKGTKVLNMQSVEMTAKNELDFIVSHRFGSINSGVIDVFGLDNATTRLNFATISITHFF